MAYKYFDALEVEMIKKFSTPDSNYINNFFEYYIIGRDYLLKSYEEKLERILTNLVKSPSFYKDNYRETSQIFINESKLGIKIDCINNDIIGRLYNKNIDIILELKSTFELNGNKNIDLVGYKLIENLDNGDKKNSLNKNIFIDIATELSNILDNEEAFNSFREYCIDYFVPKEIVKLKNEHIVNFENEIIKKATENIDKELFPYKNRIDYDNFHKVISKFIRGGTPEIYKHIIEQKRYPNINNLQFLTMISGKKTEMVRFADAFDINLRDASIIFNTKICSKDRNVKSRNEFFYFLKTYSPNLYKENNI